MKIGKAKVTVNANPELFNILFKALKKSGRPWEVWHFARSNRTSASEMTYIVSSGALNSTHSLTSSGWRNMCNSGSVCDIYCWYKNWRYLLLV